MTKNLKQILIFILVLLVFPFILTSCSSKEDTLVLRIYNWQDYIDDGTDDDGAKVAPSVLEDFQDWYKKKYDRDIEIIYDTFETNEVMLNTLKTGKTYYDLICPSEYAIQKMIYLDMLDKFDYEMKDENGELIFPNHNNVSSYIQNLFKEKDLYDYSVPYMWGTMGFIYVNRDDEVNKELIENGDIDGGYTAEQVSTWDILWKEIKADNGKGKLKASAKDSIRDTYVVGVMHAYANELNEIRNQLESGKLSQEEYTKKCGEIMNRCDDDTIDLVEENLKEMKKNIYAFEVDNGKNDIVTGKISLNFAWSGDAVYSMDVAEEEEGLNLYYSVPVEGSNVWFDGWVIPKDAKHKAEAEMFVNFLCDEEIASRNMDFIGYTSSIVGDTISERIEDYYVAEVVEELPEPSEDYLDCEVFIENDKRASEVDEYKVYLCVNNGSENDPIYEWEFDRLDGIYQADLTYLFDGNISEDLLDENGRLVYDIALSQKDRQFGTQYPSEEVIARCGIMEDFGDQYDKVLAMWENVKIGSISPWSNIIVIVGIIVIVFAIYGSRFYKSYIRKKRKEKFRVE